MIFIQKSREPQKLLEYRLKKNSRFDDMDADVKDALRMSLLQEQGYLCAYCMGRIKNGRDVKIEHYHARTSENELDYHNLLAVCKGGEGSAFEQQTCDTRKGNRKLTIDPQNKVHMRGITYSSRGKIQSQEFQTDIDDVLNLNVGYLVQNRAAALDTVRAKLHSKSGADRVKLLRKLQEKYTRKNQNGEYQAYQGILLDYIQRKLKQ